MCSASNSSLHYASQWQGKQTLRTTNSGGASYPLPFLEFPWVAHHESKEIRRKFQCNFNVCSVLNKIKCVCAH